MIVKFFVLFLSVLAPAKCCNTYNEVINYNVYDCSETESKSLGDFVLRQQKSRRYTETRNSCSQMPIEFLKDNPQKGLQPNFINPNFVAGSFVYKFLTAKEKVFWGLTSTLEALLSNKTFNIIIDKGSRPVVLNLRPKVGDGETVEKFVMYHADMEEDTIPQDMNVVSCENLFVYLARNAKPFSWSVTVTNSFHSNAEHRFFSLSGGIGGFFKPDSV